MKKPKKPLTAKQRARQVVWTMAWRAAHPEEYKNYQRPYQKQWRAENPDYGKQWRAENLERSRLKKREYRARRDKRVQGDTRSS